MKNNIFILLLLISASAFAQKTGGQKLIIITFDGYRWKDAFKGADSALFFAKARGAKDSVQRVQKFWGANTKERREKLMPFFWSTIAKKGQVYGNRDLGSYVNVKNPYWFSYPGYNEIFTGYPDTIINSNDYPANPNVTIQEFINKQPGYQNSVAAFTSWAAFDNILNKKRCGFPVNAGYTAYDAKNTNEAQKAISAAQFFIPQPLGPHERPDAITYLLGKEYLKQNHPKVLQLSFIETDAWGHRDEYNEYLQSANRNDKMLEDLWNYLQSDPFYKDQTTIFIATDHGRGDSMTKEAQNWNHHNNKTPGSDQIWFAVMGPHVKPLGEMKGQQVYQNQYAKTMTTLLGLNFTSTHTIGKAIESVVK